MLSRKNRDRTKFNYLEKHHVLPKALGGTGKKDNIVYLTPREHLLAHLLLAKIYPHDRKMQLAVLAMLKQTKGRKQDSNYTNLISSSRVVEDLRIEARKQLSESRKGVNNPMYGKKHSEESRQKMSTNSAHANKGIHLSEERKSQLREKFSGKNSPLYGKVWSKEHNEKLSRARKGKFTGKDNPFFGKTHTEEARRKISESRQKYRVKDKDGEILSITLMAKKHNVSYSTIMSWANNHPEKGITFVV